MARYCFYCGRALAQGERCSCRTARGSNFRPEFHEKKDANSASDSASGTAAAAAEGKTGETASSPDSSYKNTHSATSAGSENKKNRRSRRGFRERFAAWRADRVNERQARKSRRKQAAGRREAFTWRSGLNFIHQLFTRPTAIIASSSHAGRTKLVVTYLLEALVFSLIVLTFVRFSSLTRIAMLREMKLNNDSLWQSAGLAMFRGFIAALILSFLRVLISRLIFRFVGRQRVAMEDLYRAFLPGTYYEILFMLIALIFVSGTGLQALVMMLCAFAVRAMIDTLSLRDTVQLSTDRLLFQSAVIHFILFIALAFLLNFVVPSLSGLNVEPQNQNKFSPNLAYSEVFRL